MTLTIIFLLAQFGLTNAISKEFVFEGLREKLSKCSLVTKLISCETCLGFYIGMSLFWIMPTQTEYIQINILIAGLISSAFNKIVIILLYKF